MVLIKDILASLSTLEKVELFKRLYEHIAGMGINGDTELAHINKDEGAILKMMGGAGTINEETGLIQYFGGSPPPPPAASSTVTNQQTIPEEMKPYITDVLTQSQALNKQRTEEGYQPYQGAQIAEFQPEQQQAQTGIAGLVGSGQQYFDKAANLTEQAGQAPTAEAMQSYMSPYMQNVVDIQKREAMRQGDVAAQGQAYGATQVGAFGGSRDAIVQAEQQRNLATQLGDIQAKGSAAAYADAQQQYAAQQKNALAAGQQFGMMGSAVPGQAMKEFGALESVGAAKQQQEQQALNLAKQQFIQEQTFPEANLQQYSSIIRGYNLPPNTYNSAQAVTPAPSYMQQIAGLGMAGAGIAGAFGNFGKKEGGLVGLAKGGKVLKRGGGGTMLPDAAPEGVNPEESSQDFESSLRALSDTDLNRALSGTGNRLKDLLINQEKQKRQNSTFGFHPSVRTTPKQDAANPLAMAAQSGLAPLVAKPQAPAAQAASATPVPVKAEDGTPAITSGYTPVPDAELKSELLKPKMSTRDVKDTSKWEDMLANVGKTDEKSIEALNNIRTDLAIKLDEASEKKKGILGKRQEELGKQKWMALAEMGASVLAQPGGQTFLQAMGKGVKESGIVGTLAKIGDKSADIETDLAELDVKTMMSKYGLTKDQVAEIKDRQKMDVERLKVVSEAKYHEGYIDVLKDRTEAGIEKASLQASVAAANTEQRRAAEANKDEIRRMGLAQKATAADNAILVKLVAGDYDKNDLLPLIDADGVSATVRSYALSKLKEAPAKNAGRSTRDPLPPGSTPLT